MRTPYHFQISEIPDQGLDLEFESTPAQIRFKDPGVRFSGPIRSRIRIEKAEETVILEGNIRGGVELQCVRCLKAVVCPLDLSFRTFLEPPPEDSSPHAGEEREVRGTELEEQVFSGDTVRLDDVIREQVMLGVPSYPVCREECRGLCPVCGTNRNEKACSCPNPEGEPSMNRFREQLKKFIKKT